MKAAALPSSSPSIPWRMRADLRAVPLEFEGRPAWGIKDPVTLGYFELHNEEFFVLNQLDGMQSVDSIRESFYERFRPRTLSAEELKNFVGHLVSQNLVAAERQGHGRYLVARRQSIRFQRWIRKVTSLLAIRFRGFDPDQLFGRMLPWLNWLFTPWVVFAGLLLIACDVVLISVHFDELLRRLPDAQAFLTPANLVWLSLTLALVKLLHEFGHGLTCKRFGGECHELGVMLLVFTPTLYCNVSDIWMVNDKWKRIAVSLAGIWVEAMIAAACTLLWWFSAPGLFQSLCFNLMFLCGVSTFVFNGNPLLRYDGYFALADWLEIPNLQQQAMTAVRTRFGDWFFVSETPAAHRPASSREWGLIAYGLASSIYRVMLTFAILWGMHRWLSPLGLGVFVQMLAAITLGSLILTPIFSTARFVRSPTNRGRIRFWRSVIVASLFVVLLGMPFPYGVTAEAIVDDDAQRVYVTLAGTLIESVPIGQHVDEGQVIAQLDEPRLKVVLTQLEGELNQQRSRLEQLERRRVNEPHLATQIPTVREVVRDLEQQVAQRHRDAERLALRAPCAGTVLPGPRHRGNSTSDALLTWTGSPLEEKNRGSFLREGTTVCLVGNPHSRTVLVMISQDDVNLVRSGQSVRLSWNELSGEVMQGEIVDIAGLDLDKLSREAFARLNLPARFTTSRGFQPVGTWYQDRVIMNDTDPLLLRGSTGKARILVQPMSLFGRIVRWFKQTFPLTAIG